MSTGTMMFYGGIAGTAVFLLLFLICLRVFAAQRKKLAASIEREQAGESEQNSKQKENNEIR